MYENWVLSFQFQWTPILTFTRRRLQLLDWFEKNTEPVAFVDEPERVGVGIISPDLRLTVRRASVSIESGASGLAVEKLRPAIDGVFEVLTPRGMIGTRFMATGVTPLDDADYDGERRAFGTMAGGRAFSDSDQFAVSDGSALVDLVSDDLYLQVEWGIVSGDELLERLSDPEMSRISGRGDDEGQGALVRRTARRRDVPLVGIFTDQMGTWRRGSKVASPEDVLNLISEAQLTTSTVATSFADMFQRATKEAK